MRVLAFDSGVGGLTAIAPFFRSCLQEGKPLDMTYFGDLANLPYGTKSPSRIRELTGKNLEALLSARIGEGSYDLLVIACNTASSHALEVAQKLGAEHKVPTVGVLEPGCRAALKASSERVVILATGSTVSSGAYPLKLLQLGFRGQVLQKACPLFVPLVEDGLHSGPAVEWVMRHYLDSLLQPGDNVILGCTHYPFLTSTLRHLYPDCRFVEPGTALQEDPIVRNARARKNTSSPSLALYFSDTSTNELQARNLVRQLDFGGTFGEGPGAIHLNYEVVSPVL